jgi:hypothetical protein
VQEIEGGEEDRVPRMCKGERVHATWFSRPARDGRRGRARGPTARLRLRRPTTDHANLRRMLAGSRDVLEMVGVSGRTTGHVVDIGRGSHTRPMWLHVI